MNFNKNRFFCVSDKCTADFLQQQHKILFANTTLIYTSLNLEGFGLCINFFVAWSFLLHLKECTSFIQWMVNLSFEVSMYVLSYINA